MKALAKKMTCLLLAVCTLFSLALVGCGGGGAHKCESKCPKCGFCLNLDCEEKACELKCPGHKEEKATVTGVDIVAEPRTSYYPGETFDVARLVIEASMSNGKKKFFYDYDFTEWTHKGEQLTKDVTKITLTVPGYDYEFDLAITVAFPTDLTMSVDAGLIKETYLTTDVIDFTAISVKLFAAGVTTALKADEWKLKKSDGTEIANKAAVTAGDLGTGTITLTVEYLPEVKQTISITVRSKEEAIVPSFIEAENCVFSLTGVDKDSESSLIGEETNNRYSFYEGYTHYQTVGENGTVGDGANAANGASGRGAVSMLQGGQNGKTVYFKFDVSAPADGEYLIKARGLSTYGYRLSEKAFAFNVNGKKGTDGKLEFSYSDKTDFIYGGNQLKNYCEGLSSYDFPGWYNMAWWCNFEVGKVTLKKGNNTVRIYMPTGFNGNIDYFEIMKADVKTETKITSMRSGTKVDLSKNVLYINNGVKLTDMVPVPEKHPARYTLLYICLTNGKEIPVLGSMIEGKIDYTKIGVQQTVEVEVDGEKASFKLVIENVVED